MDEVIVAIVSPLSLKASFLNHKRGKKKLNFKPNM